MFKINDYSLYLVISEEYGLGRGALEIARQAISGGIDMIQMREKHKQKDELLELACGLSSVCRENGVLFIVNDDPLLALESKACGVHLGQTDLQKYSIAKTREVIGRDKIIGVSTHSISEVKKTNKEEIDYIAYGPIFPTKTKNYFLGTQDIKEVLRVALKPVFFIGGIQLSNLEEVIKEGAKNIAVIRDIVGAKDIASRTRSFKEILAGEKKTRFMMIKINGQNESVEKRLNLLGLIESKKFSPDAIVVEHNFRIVPRQEWPGVLLNENDSIEIVSFVGGG